MQKQGFVTALLVAVLSGAHAEVIDITWSDSGRFNHRGTVAAGKFVEACGPLPAGLAVGWRFKASAPVDFNVHYHLGKDVVFPSKLPAVVSAKQTLHTQTEQDYCWMWSNKSASPVTLVIDLQR